MLFEQNQERNQIIDSVLKNVDFSKLSLQPIEGEKTSQGWENVIKQSNRQESILVIL